MSREKKAIFVRPGAEPYEYDPDEDDGSETTLSRNNGPKLRSARSPYLHRAEYDELYKDLDRSKGRLGILTFPFGKRWSVGESTLTRDVYEGVEPVNVRYAGSYMWKGPVTKVDLVDSKYGKSSQEKVFVTPGKRPLALTWDTILDQGPRIRSVSVLGAVRLIR